MKAKRSLQNLIAAFFAQGVTLILGFVVPRLTLLNYGSDINGFMSLVTQIYAYVALLEAGLGTTMVQALYAPITTDNKIEISGIVSAAKIYYRKLALYYAGAVVAVALVLPFVLDSELSKIEISVYFILFGISNVINFCFTAAMRPILLAEGKNYVNSNITTIFHVFSQFAKILLLSLGVNIIILQATYSVINILQIVVYYVYFKKNYSWINKKEKPLFGKLKQRNAFFLHQVSNLVFSCTDMVIISAFCDLKSVSVYTVYLLIFNAISTLMSLFSNSTVFVLGQSYNEDKEKYVGIHRAYETALVTLAFSLFSIAYVLTIPFMKLYTAGINDINYIDFLLPAIFATNGMLSTCKSTSLNLINFSYHAKQTMNRTVVEAGINLVLSIVLAPLLGIRGVLIGTSIALVYRVIDLLIYANRRILKTSVLKPLKLFVVNYFVFAAIIVINRFVNISVLSYTDFIVAGIVTSLVVFSIYFAINILIDIKQSKTILELLKKKVLKR